MHSKTIDRAVHPAVVPVTFLAGDHHALGMTGPEQTVLASTTQSLLEVALEHGINIEHACGGVCACSTCHVYIESGSDQLSGAIEAEDDRVEEAPGLQRNSRLCCQCEILNAPGARATPIVVRIPAWNRNAVKEVPH
jgi:2Fe-2S ferredoxin